MPPSTSCHSCERYGTSKVIASVSPKKLATKSTTTPRMCQPSVTKKPWDRSDAHIIEMTAAALNIKRGNSSMNMPWMKPNNAPQPKAPKSVWEVKPNARPMIPGSIRNMAAHVYGANGPYSNRKLSSTISLHGKKCAICANQKVPETSDTNYFATRESPESNAAFACQSPGFMPEAK